jgi:hypothetical protein
LIVERLVAVLATPSEAVQRSVSGCLSPLAAGLAGDRAFMEGVVRGLLATLSSSESYAER